MLHRPEAKGQALRCAANPVQLVDCSLYQAVCSTRLASDPAEGARIGEPLPSSRTPRNPVPSSRAEMGRMWVKMGPSVAATIQTTAGAADRGLYGGYVG